MTHNRFSDHTNCSYRVHKSRSYQGGLNKNFLVRTEYSAFKCLSKISQEQAAAVVIIALISEKNKSREKRKKRKVGLEPWLKRRKNLGFYETLLPELWLEHEYNYKNYLQMTSVNFEYFS